MTCEILQDVLCLTSGIAPIDVGRECAAAQHWHAPSLQESSCWP